MDCKQARELNLEGVRGTLSPELAAELDAHRSTCARCRADAEAERVLDDALETKLPQYAAPMALKRKLAVSWPAGPSPARTPSRVRRLAAPIALAVGLALAVGSATGFVVQRRADWSRLEGESVNDHLRVLEGAELAQVTGGLHEVKPWFGGRLDFAPMVRFAGSADFPLQGGAVEPFLDRRAAVFVYKRRLHAASLFVVRADGLAFPATSRTETVRGFNVVMWKEADQGYALVSDLSLPELLELQKQIVAP
jgi:anti-sigma factor RsiW